MPPFDSPRPAWALDARQMNLARNLLVSPRPPQRAWPALAAAAFAATSALALATATILAPPVVTQHVVKSSR
jgi:hypothetical protein